MALVHCTGCGADFTCGAGSGQCWCMALPHITPMPVAEKSAGCFCRECLTMNQALVTLPAVTVAYLRHVGAYGPELSQLWIEFRNWANPRKLWTPTSVFFGISHDNPMTTPAAQCRYDACVEIPPSMNIDGGASRAQLPGGAYVKLAFHGKGPAVGPAFARLFDEVIPAAKKQRDFTRPVFELYTGSNCMEQDGTFTCDLCAPVS